VFTRFLLSGVALLAAAAHVRAVTVADLGLSVPGAPRQSEGAMAPLVTTGASGGQAAEASPDSAAAPATLLRDSLPEGPERELLTEVLERNPELAALEAAARAAAQRSPQVSSLPDPLLAVTGYIWPVETRVGPMHVMASISQRLPWFGKLKLREQAALDEALAAGARLEAGRLRLLTDARRLYDELAFLAAFEKIVRDDRATLSHYEEVSRARYATGVGLEQAIIKIQAEITKDDARLLDIATRRVALVASINALRNRPQDTPFESSSLPGAFEVRLNPESLRSAAVANRPEVAAADADIARAGALVELANKDYAPDVTLGLSYTSVGKRTDAAGMLAPPPDNGQDALALSGAINLPIWTRRLRAGHEEALEARSRSEDMKRSTVVSIEQALGDLVARIPLTWQRWRLFQDVLLIQADQSLRSAEAGYSAGTLAALDLLDAERVLLEVRIQASRTLTDYFIALVQLEGTIGRPLAVASPELKESRP
jgi:cobalt-zinc-cadmium efflux system outer membrane protein